jgi:K+-sensing histidine kinase KdpD
MPQVLKFWVGCAEIGGVSQGTAEAGEVLAATEVAVDAARDAIALARAQRDELLVLASHDIRNAVGIVDSALSMLEDGPELAPSMHGMMRRATHRLQILVRALVDVDLLDRGLMPLVTRDTGWEGLVTPVLEVVRPVAATKEISVAAGGDLDARLTCDPDLVGRLVAVLVEHVVSTAPTTSAVALDAGRVADDRFRVRVSHGGRAVPASALDRYFTTLPLRFARLAAARHGGILRVVSPLEGGVGMALEVELAG